ncbi:hypothetical protein AX14_012669 [Amanita brunnescens Koide BX004]|nr:hypothetical protein AX14_012669 [Amanita brunnescens Koide BX004]
MSSTTLDARAVAEYLTSIRDDEKRKQIDLQDSARLLTDKVEQLSALPIQSSDEGWTRLREALAFIGQVKTRYEDKPEVYQRFLRALGNYQRKLVDTATTVGQVRQLLSGEALLLEGFEGFVQAVD